MNMDILQKNDIFLIPIGDYLYCEKSAYYIVYSPLKGRMLAADNKGLEQLHEIIPELVSDLQADDLLSKVEKASDLQKCLYCQTIHAISTAHIAILQKEGVIRHFNMMSLTKL